MTQVFIDPTATNIAVQILSQSLHTVQFLIKVFAVDGNTVIEQYTGNTETNNPFIQRLNSNPSSYKGGFISGIFTVVSPDGSDGSYSITFSIMIDGTTITPTMPLTGNTSGGKDMTGGTFHLN